MRHAHGQSAKSSRRSGLRNRAIAQRPSAEPAADGGDQQEGEAAGGAAKDAGNGQQRAPQPVALLYAAFVLAAPDADRAIVTLWRAGEILRSLPPTPAAAANREQDQQRADDPVHGAVPLNAATGRYRSWRTASSRQPRPRRRQRPP